MAITPQIQVTEGRRILVDAIEYMLSDFDDTKIVGNVPVLRKTPDRDEALEFALAVCREDPNRTLPNSHTMDQIRIRLAGAFNMIYG